MLENEIIGKDDGGEDEMGEDEQKEQGVVDNERQREKEKQANLAAKQKAA